MACVRFTISFTQVAHPFASFAKGWGIARSASALLLLAGTCLLHAQSAGCGLTSIKEQSQLVYPPIARAAHVGGTVIVLTRFERSGIPVSTKVVSGPPLLQAAAFDFVRSWRANEYTGPRECPIIINFRMIEGDKPVCSYEEAGPPRFTRADMQHVSVAVQGVWMCDPGLVVTKTHKR